MIRAMQIEDYEQVYALWLTISGFAIRSVDDSKEGVERFLQRNPGISVVAEEDGKIVGRSFAGMTADEAACIMSVWIRRTDDVESVRTWSFTV